MKVLHVIDALGVGGGAEHSLATMLPLLAERGIESNVACLIARRDGLEHLVRRQGFDVEVLAARSWPGRVRALRHKIRSEAPDVVHATLFNSCLVARVACVGLRVPLVNSLVNTSYDPVRVSELDIPRWKLYAVKVVDGFTARHLVDHIHAITRSVRAEAIHALRVPPERVTVIPRGRSAAVLGEASVERRLEVRAGLGLDGSVPVVLNVGRQDLQKGQADLIRAFAKLVESLPNAVLLIAGRDGDASGQVQAALDATEMRASVRLLGHRTDVADLFAAADVFAFPSFYEGLGCSLIEAMALAVPVIGSDAAAITEVLGDGEFGEVVRRGDIVGLASKMRVLLNDPDLRKRLGAAGHQQFVAKYELDRVVDSMAEMYRSLLRATAQ